jgi:hypothetical protein
MNFRTRKPDHVGNLLKVLKSYLHFNPHSRIKVDGENFIVSARDGGRPTVINGGMLENAWATAARLKRWAERQKLQ